MSVQVSVSMLGLESCVSAVDATRRPTKAISSRLALGPLSGAILTSVLGRGPFSVTRFQLFKTLPEHGRSVAV